MKQLNILNPVSLILEKFFNRIKQSFPDLVCIYDPSLQIESSVRSLRSIKSAYGLTKDATFPLLSYSRTVFMTGSNQHWQPYGKNLRAVESISDTSYVAFNVMPGEFDLNFRLYTDNPAQLEYFETAYMTQSFITDLQKERMNFDDGRGGNIPSANQSSYIPTVDDVRPGAPLTCVVTVEMPEAGKTITLQSSDAGTTYQWKKDDVVIPKATSSSYTPVETNGVFTCVVTIGSPQVSEEITLKSASTNLTYQWRNEASILVRDWPITYKWNTLEDFQYDKEQVINFSFAGTGKFSTSLICLEEFDRDIISGVNFKIVNFYNQNQIYYQAYFDVENREIRDAV